MKRRYDWISLKDEFCRSQFLTVSEFFQSKNILSNSYTRNRTKGWGVEKTAYLKRVITETQTLSIKSVAGVRSRQAMMAQELQIKGIDGLAKLPVTDCDVARKLVVDGLEEERRCLGLDGKDNINSTGIDTIYPVSEWDKYLEGLSYEEILLVIAQIKRERQRRQSKAGVNAG